MVEVLTTPVSTVVQRKTSARAHDARNLIALLGPDHRQPRSKPPNMPRQTASRFTHDFNRIAQENERRCRERDEAIHATNELKRRIGGSKTPFEKVIRFITRNNTCFTRLRDFADSVLRRRQ